MFRRAANNVFRASYAGDVDSGGRPRPGRWPSPSCAAAARSRSVDPTRWSTSSRCGCRCGGRPATALPVNGIVRLQRRNGGGDWRLVRRLRTGSDGRAHLTRAPARRHQLARPGAPARLGLRRHQRGPPDQQPPARRPGPAAERGAPPPDQPARPAACRRRRAEREHLADPGGGLEPDDRTHLAPRLPGRPVRACATCRSTTGTTAATAAAASWSPTRRRSARWPARWPRCTARSCRSGRCTASTASAGPAGCAEETTTRSMAAGNTSAFNCRDVVGRPGVRSPHSYGRSLDLNTWENPYRSQQGTVPNTWWMGHSHPRVAWRSRSHAVVQADGQARAALDLRQRRHPALRRLRLPRPARGEVPLVRPLQVHVEPARTDSVRP